jgi:hypothetical protein
LQPALDGTIDNAFVTKVSSSGSLSYSTYLGGTGYRGGGYVVGDQGLGITVDGSGDAYVTGRTNSIDFPIKNALQPNPSYGLDGFISKLNPTGGALVWSTYLGGGGNDQGNGIGLDSQGNVYVTGDSNSPNFPLRYDLQDGNAGGYDAFLSEVSAGGNSLVYSTQLGGSGNDFGTALTVGVTGTVYLAGYTYSANFPTAGPVQGLPGGAQDGFVAGAMTRRAG